MIRSASLVIVAFAVGVASACLVPGLAESVRKAIGLPAMRALQVREEPTNGAEARKPSSEAGAEQQIVKLTDQQISSWSQFKVAR
jgi:hypothetical protein